VNPKEVNPSRIQFPYPEGHFEVLSAPDVHALVIGADLVKVLLEINVRFYIAILLALVPRAAGLES
jgi:hypothetical protein